MVVSKKIRAKERSSSSNRRFTSGARTKKALILHAKVVYGSSSVVSDNVAPKFADAIACYSAINRYKNYAVHC